MAFEAQISYASKTNVQRRSKRAWKDKLTPLWATPSLKAPLVDVAPWAGISRMSWDQYRDVNELPVIGGVRGLVKDRCGERGILCPDRKKGRRCPGWHFRWEPQRMNNLDDLVVRAAYGEWIPYDHRTSRNTVRWFWSSPPRPPRSSATSPHGHPAPAGRSTTTRKLDGTCTYGQDAGLPSEVLPRADERIVVAARPVPARQSSRLRMSHRHHRRWQRLNQQLRAIVTR